MLSRDNYTSDFIYKYYPKFSHENFEKDMFIFNKRILYLLTFSEQEKQNMTETFNLTMYSTTGCLLTSALAVIFRKKIPGLRLVEKRWKKYLMNFFILLLPYSIASSYGTFKGGQMFATFYNEKFLNYKKYKQNGDFRELTKNIHGKTNK